MKQMMKARSRVDFAIFTFSGSSGIDDTMLTLHQNIAFRGVLDRTQGGAKWAATPALVAAGDGDLFSPAATRRASASCTTS